MGYGEWDTVMFGIHSVGYGEWDTCSGLGLRSTQLASCNRLNVQHVSDSF